MIVFSHPTGNSNVREAVLSLQQAGVLAEFWTCLGWRKNRPWASFLPRSIRSEIERRPIPEELAGKIHLSPWREAGRLISGRLGWKQAIRHEEGPFCIDRIFQGLDRKVAAHLGSVKAGRGVYAYEDGALETFREAKRRGWKTFYDLPIGYHLAAQRIFAEERELMPAFASTLGGLNDSPKKLERKAEELALADRVLCCSGFVRETLLEAGVSPDKISQVQFGAPNVESSPPEKSDSRGRPLRLLFAGAIGQRKGIAYLLEAVRCLGRSDIELILLGAMPEKKEMFQPYASWFRHEAPRPNQEVLKLMRSCDAFVLPSVFEGQALVILEAMSAGLPVIITPNTGGSNLVEEGREGFVVPIRSIEALMEKIALMADHREETIEMGRNAWQRAKATTWANYRQQIRSAVLKELQQSDA